MSIHQKPIRELLDNVEYIKKINALFKADSAREIYLPDSEEEQLKIEEITKELHFYFDWLTEARKIDKYRRMITTEDYDAVNHYETVFCVIFVEREKRYAIAKKKAVVPKLVSKLREEKDKSVAGKISLAENISGVQSREVEDRKLVLKKELKKRTKYLNSDYSNLVKAALEIKMYYEKHRRFDADDLRYELLTDEGEDEGRKKLKFIDLWLEEYLPNLLLHIPENELNPEKVNKEVTDLVRRAEYVHFISVSTEPYRMISSIQRGLIAESNYIAVHSLGSATFTAAKIIVTVERDFSHKGYKTSQKNELGREVFKIWYREKEGIETLRLFESLKEGP